MKSWLSQGSSVSRGTLTPFKQALTNGSIPGDRRQTKTVNNANDTLSNSCKGNRRLPKIKFLKRFCKVNFLVLDQGQNSSTPPYRLVDWGGLSYERGGDARRLA